MGHSSWVHISVEKILKATEKAFLCRIADCDEDVWLPFSQVSDPQDYSEGDEDCEMSITEWLAKEKGID